MTLFKTRIVIKGMNVQKFIGRLGQECISVWNARSVKNELSFLCESRDKEKISQLAVAKGFHLEKPKPVGLYALICTLSGRMLLLAGVILLIAGVVFSMTRVWRVCIIDANEYIGEVQLALKENGIHAFMPKAHVKTNQLKDALEWRLPRVKWVQVYFSGADLNIKIIAGTAAGEAGAYQGSGDIVASEDGIVKTILTFAGTPFVRAGDTVKKGQVLIRGMERREKESSVPVKACGSIEARVFMQTAVRVPTTELLSEQTGNSLSRRGVVTPFIELWSAQAPDYLVYDLNITRMPLVGAYLPAQIVHETYDEVYLEKQQRDLEEVKREAGIAALRKLNLALGFHDEVIDKWVDYSMIEGDLIEAKATAEILREIGRYCKDER